MQSSAYNALLLEKNMEQRKRIDLKPILPRLLRPSMAWMILLTVLSVAALIFVFTTALQETALGYMTYALSAYTLVVVVLGIVPAAKNIYAFALKLASRNKYGLLYMTDLPYRARISLYLSLTVNLAYAVFQLIAGIIYASFWFGAVAVYYIVLCVGRFLLLKDVRKEQTDIRNEYRKYRMCGIVLFIMNLALTGMVYQMIVQGQGFRYPGLLIYPVCTYAFYRLTLSIIGAVTYRKLNRPLLSASKIINLMAALVAMFSLQIAMFASFGGGEELQRLMNTISGSIVCIAIFSMAVFMVVRANSRLRQIDNDEYHELI